MPLKDTRDAEGNYCSGPAVDIFKNITVYSVWQSQKEGYNSIVYSGKSHPSAKTVMITTHMNAGNPNQCRLSVVLLFLMVPIMTIYDEIHDVDEAGRVAVEELLIKHAGLIEEEMKEWN